MLDRQQQEFVGGARLLDMTLGLAAIGERVAALLSRRRADGAMTDPGQPLALAILGMLSIRRTLWAALAVQPTTLAPAAPAADVGGPVPAGLLR